MALSSMTGFTRSGGQYEQYRWTWEVKSVNGKGLDIRFRLPPGFDEMERKLKAVLTDRLTRGSVFVNLNLQQDASKQTLKINDDVLSAVLAAMDQIENRIDAKKPSLDGILSMRGVMELVEEDESEDARGKLIEAMLASFDDAANDLVDARQAEGRALEKILLKRIEELDSLITQAEDCPARSPEAIRAKLKQQIERIMDEGMSLDEDRLYQEAVVLAGKADVREELDRLYTHCEAAHGLINQSRPVGRKFDFLAQEFNREANTLCSKSNDSALTAIGLELKSVIEQLREQIQNVE